MVGETNYDHEEYSLGSGIGHYGVELMSKSRISVNIYTEERLVLERNSTTQHLWCESID